MSRFPPSSPGIGGKYLFDLKYHHRATDHEYPHTLAIDGDIYNPNFNGHEGRRHVTRHHQTQQPASFNNTKVPYTQHNMNGNVAHSKLKNGNSANMNGNVAHSKLKHGNSANTSATTRSEASHSTSSNVCDASTRGTYHDIKSPATSAAHSDGLRESQSGQGKDSEDEHRQTNRDNKVMLERMLAQKRRQEPYNTLSIARLEHVKCGGSYSLSRERRARI